MTSIKKFMELALKYLGEGYWWGAKMIRATRENLERLKSRPWNPPERYFFQDSQGEVNAEHWIGKVNYCADCSGYITHVLQKTGINVRHINTYDMWEQFGFEITREELRPGDLCYTQNLGHVAWYKGNNRVVHAQSTRNGIRETSMYASFTRFQRMKFFRESWDTILDKRLDRPEDWKKYFEELMKDDLGQWLPDFVVKLENNELNVNGMTWEGIIRATLDRPEDWIRFINEQSNRELGKWFPDLIYKLVKVK